MHCMLQLNLTKCGTPPAVFGILTPHRPPVFSPTPPSAPPSPFRLLPLPLFPPTPPLSPHSPSSSPPARLIRDIAFVVFCPPLLLSSDHVRPCNHHTLLSPTPHAITTLSSPPHHMQSPHSPLPHTTCNHHTLLSPTPHAFTTYPLCPSPFPLPPTPSLLPFACRSPCLLHSSDQLHFALAPPCSALSCSQLSPPQPLSLPPLSFSPCSLQSPVVVPHVFSHNSSSLSLLSSLSPISPHPPLFLAHSPLFSPVTSGGSPRHTFSHPFILLSLPDLSLFLSPPLPSLSFPLIPPCSRQLPVVDPHVFASNSSLLMPTTLPNSTSSRHHPQHTQYTKPYDYNNDQSGVSLCDSSEMDGQDALLAWLELLDEGYVAVWFREKKQSARLGDHYALCVLFVLTFGPNLKPRNLRTSVQVHVAEARGKPTRLIFPEPSTETDKTLSEPLSEPLPESESSMLNVTPSGLLKPGPHQAKLPSLKGLGVPNLELAPARPELEFPELRQMGRRARKRFLRESRDRKGRIQTVGEFDVLFTLPPPHSPPPQSLSPPSAPPVSPPPLSPDHSHSPVLSLKEVGVCGTTAAAAADGGGTGDGDTAGVAAVGNSATAAAVATVQSPTPDSDVASTAAAAASAGGDATLAAPAPVLYHWELSVKFLLFVGSWDDALAIFSRHFPPSQAGCGSSCSSSSNSSNSSNSSSSSSSSSSSCSTSSISSHESLCESEVPPEGVPPEESPDPEWLLGQYLGPHVGESLRDRKARLSRQLQLGQQGHGGQLITRMYGSTVEGGGSTDTDPPPCTDRRWRGQESERILRNGEMAEKIEAGSEAFGAEESGEESSPVGRISSLQAAALLQGYLFYEYPLWVEMRAMEEGCGGRNGKGASVLATPETEESALDALTSDGTWLESSTVTCTAADTAAEGAAVATAAGTAAAPGTGVFPWHWHGWWTHDAAAVVLHPRHAYSRWYILPKDEWLSPVFVPDATSPTRPQHPVTTSPSPRLDDISPGAVPDPGATCEDAELGAGFAWRPDGIATPLLGDVLLETIYRCSEDARSRKLPRKLRFLVAELRWDPEYLTSKNIRVFDSSIDNACEGFGHGEESGAAWVEVSRGFIVEEGWPDSRSHPPHGFVWREGRGTPFW
ncbi:unnamed protein product [Closterium sp. NIES-53]